MIFPFSFFSKLLPKKHILKQNFSSQILVYTCPLEFHVSFNTVNAFEIWACRFHYQLKITTPSIITVTCLIFPYYIRSFSFFTICLLVVISLLFCVSFFRFSPYYIYTYDKALSSPLYTYVCLTMQYFFLSLYAQNFFYPFFSFCNFHIVFAMFVANSRQVKILIRFRLLLLRLFDFSSKMKWNDFLIKFL